MSVCGWEGTHPLPPACPTTDRSKARAPSSLPPAYTPPPPLFPQPGTPTIMPTRVLSLLGTAPLTRASLPPPTSLAVPSRLLVACPSFKC